MELNKISRNSWEIQFVLTYRDFRFTKFTSYQGFRKKLEELKA